MFELSAIQSVGVASIGISFIFFSYQRSNVRKGDWNKAIFWNNLAVLSGTIAVFCGLFS